MPRSCERTRARAHASVCVCECACVFRAGARESSGAVVAYFRRNVLSQCISRAHPFAESACVHNYSFILGPAFRCKWQRNSWGEGGSRTCACVWCAMNNMQMCIWSMHPVSKGCVRIYMNSICLVSGMDLIIILYIVNLEIDFISNEKHSSNCFY